MDKILVKTWLYTFLATLSLCIIFIQDSIHSSLSGRTYLVPLRHYIFEVLRRSLAASLIVTGIVGAILAIRYFRRRQ